MSQREFNKQEKRNRIVEAAINILSNEGIEALTMRRLAEDAGVSSRTPYNLFDSKTDILLVIMMQAIAPLETLDADGQTDLALSEMFDVLGSMLTLTGEREAFYRSVHWAIMRSDDMEAKMHGRAMLDRLIAGYLNRALAQRELKADCDVDALSTHISVLLASVLGMWADSQLKMDEAVGHIRLAWANGLLPHARGKGLQYLRETAILPVPTQITSQEGRVA